MTHPLRKGSKTSLSSRRGDITIIKLEIFELDIDSRNLIFKLLSFAN